MNPKPAKNEVVVFRKRREPSLGLLQLLGPEKMVVYSEEGKTLAVDREKLLFGTGLHYAENTTEHEAKLSLRGLRRELEGARHTIDLEPLWGCMPDSEETRELRELDELYFGAGERVPMDTLVFFWALDKDGVYFSREPGGYRPNTARQVEDTLKRKEAESRRKHTKRAAVAWVRAVIEGAEPGPGPQEHREYLDLIKNFIIHMDKMDKAPQARSFMSETGLRNTDDAIAFLVSIGHWKEHDDPAILRLGISKDFPKKVVEQADAIITAAPSFDGVVDLTSLDVFSVDDENTEDIDDALSISLGPDGPMLGIHITDVAGYVPGSSPLDTEALRRGETIYLPESHVHMFPPELIEKRLSLFAGELGRALSVLVNFDAELNITGYNFVVSRIKVRRNITYTEANTMLTETDEGRALGRITDKLRLGRIERGAFIIDLPDLKVQIGEGGDLGVRQSYMSTPSHFAVAECMILMNWLAGDFLKTAGVPGIYRSLTEAISAEARELDPQGPLYPLRVVRYLRTSRFGTIPLPHNFLGVDCYVQVTSPIRRYLDLVMQRQITSQIRGRRAAYDARELEGIYQMLSLETREKKQVGRQRTRYWLCKYLADRTGERQMAYISQMDERTIMVYIPEYLLELPLTITPEVLDMVKNLGVESPLPVLIDRVDPIKRQIEVVPA